MKLRQFLITLLNIPHSQDKEDHQMTFRLETCLPPLRGCQEEPTNFF